MQKRFDLAAEADIEDVLMCDYAGVLAWLLLAPDTPVLQAGTARISFADCSVVREDVAPIMQESVLEGSLNRSIWRRSKRRSLSIWAS